LSRGYIGRKLRKLEEKRERIRKCKKIDRTGERKNKREGSMVKEQKFRSTVRKPAFL
jgi:hypothetical protein